MQKLRVLDLFSGLGGFSMGLEATGWFETAAFVEQDSFCQKILAQTWPEVPIYEDVRTVDPDRFGRIDCITAGWPCQPVSVAGKRRGEEDDRYLWPEVLRLIKKLRPDVFIGENVTGLITMGLDEVLSDLEAADYTPRAFVIPAVAIDAKHRRDRVFIVAYAAGEFSNRRGPITKQTRREEFTDRSETLADPNSDDVQREFTGRVNTQEREKPGKRPSRPQDAVYPRFWEPEPGVGRVAHGVPNRAHRIKALGNSIVWQLVERLGHAIITAGAEHDSIPLAEGQQGFRRRRDGN